MFHSILFLLLSATQYGPAQAHQDSLFIYSVYAQSDTAFEEATEPGQWHKVSDSIEHVTAEAVLRLIKYNKQKYVAIDELNREAIGVALVFPQPSSVIPTDPTTPDAGLKAETKPAGEPAKEIAFKVLDEQTHFMTSANGKGKIPYVVMNYYAKGRIWVKSEKLDPVTFQPIQTEAAGLTASSK